MTFDITTAAPLAVQKTRTYHRFSDAAQDVVNARVYLGIHFRFADLAARTGARVWPIGLSITSCCRSTMTMMIMTTMVAKTIMMIEE